MRRPSLPLHLLVLLPLVVLVLLVVVLLLLLVLLLLVVAFQLLIPARPFATVPVWLCSPPP